jgi:serine/threonine-protein kinase
MSLPTFGRYRLLRPLARGATGQVFLAVQGVAPALTVVVLKRLHPQVARLPQVRERFFDEARLTLTLPRNKNLSGLVSTFEVGEAEGLPYTTNTYVPGPSIRSILLKQERTQLQVPIWLLVEIMARAADAVAQLYDCDEPKPGEPNFAHADLSPQHVLVSRSGEVKLIDYAVVGIPGITGVPAWRPHLRQFASPELLKGEPVVAPSDLYTLTLALVRLLGLEYQPPDEQGKVRLSNFSWQTRLFQSFLMRALHPDPHQRFDSPAEYAKALRELQLAVPAPPLNLPDWISDLALEGREVYRTQRGGPAESEKNLTSPGAEIWLRRLLTPEELSELSRPI